MRARDNYNTGQP